jgi:CRP-like cAMP-binding protein
MEPFAAGPWQVLHPPDEPVTHVSLILSGRVGVYRKHSSGRRILVQVLCEDELLGLHALADPSNPNFLYRTLTPVLLLRVEWSQAEQLIIAQTTKPVLTNLVQKLPFLARISLCQNWHMQAIQRFAELSVIKDYRENDVMLQDGVYSESFYILMEGEARITKRGKLLSRMSRGNFFGEIGLLQNSRATAQVTAGAGARSLCIQRRDFLRFVAHNYSVALELERVSSKRLGRPIFPLAPDNFKTI